MVPICKQSAAALELTIDRARHTNAQPLKTSSERPAVLRLRDEMHMIALNREMNQPEAEPLARMREQLALLETAHAP